MLLNLLTMSGDGNQIGIPTVTTAQMSNKLNGITAHIWALLGGIIGNVAIVALGITIIGFILSAAFKSKKGMVGFGVGILGVLFGIMVFSLDPSLVGWAKGLIS